MTTVAKVPPRRQQRSLTTTSFAPAHLGAGQPAVVVVAAQVSPPPLVRRCPARLLHLQQEPCAVRVQRVKVLFKTTETRLHCRTAPAARRTGRANRTRLVRQPVHRRPGCKRTNKPGVKLKQPPPTTKIWATAYSIIPLTEQVSFKLCRQPYRSPVSAGCSWPAARSSRRMTAASPLNIAYSRELSQPVLPACRREESQLLDGMAQHSSYSTRRQHTCF